ncbi:MAG: hypothetical protein ABII74_00725 [Elusimicrobiota bacterium]
MQISLVFLSLVGLLLLLYQGWQAGILVFIGKGFKLANQNWKMISMVFGFYLAMGLINLPIQNKLPRAGTLAQDIPLFWAVMAILMLIINFLAGVFLQGGLLSFVKEIIKKGETSFANFWQGGKKFYLKLFLFSLLVVSAIIILMVVMLMCGLLFSLLARGNQAVMQMIFFVFIFLGGIIGFVVSVFVVFSPFIIVDQEEKLFPAIRESFDITTKNLTFWRFLVTIFSVVTSFVPALVIQLLFKNFYLKLKSLNFWKTLLLLLILGVGVVVISVPLVLLVNLPFGGNITAGVQILNVALNSLLAGYFSLVIISAMMNYYLAISKPKEEPVF